MLLEKIIGGAFSATDQQRLSRAKRLLRWGPAGVGLVLLPVMMTAEESGGLWLLFRWRGAIGPPEEVIVVGIDENTEEALEGPVNRSMHADLVDMLVHAGASIIVFDSFLHNSSEYDDRFSRAIAESGNVILAARLERDRRAGIDVQTLRAPIPSLATRALGTAPWIVPEVFRINWTFLRDDFGRPTIPLMALQAYLYDEFVSLLRAVRPNVAARLPHKKADFVSAQPLETIMAELRRAFANDPSLAPGLLAKAGTGPLGLGTLLTLYEREDIYRLNRLYPNYYGPPRTVVTVPYQQVLTGRLQEHQFAGKAVFVGYSARRQPGERDDYPYVYSTDGFNLSGVEMAATVFANLLHGNYLKLPALPLRAALALAWGLIIAACFSRCRVRLGLIVGALLITVYLSGALFAFRAEAVWLPVVVPAIQFLFAGILSVRVKQLADRAQLGIATGEEAALALTGRGKPEKLDHRVILFADEQGSKKRVRRALAELDVSQRRALQHDFAAARDLPITTNGGRINHTLADSLLAYWTTPHDRNATNLAAPIDAACRAALAIHAQMAALGLRYPGYELSMRVGLDWGEVLSSLNPSPGIKDWRMEGAPIHTAERLESLNKTLGTSTLISHAIASHIDKRSFRALELGTFVFCDDCGDIVVDQVRVYELLTAEGVTEAGSKDFDPLHSALAVLRQGEWHAALSLFEELAGQGHRHRSLASRYAGWCRQTLQEAHPSWRGVVMVAFSDKSQYLDRFTCAKGSVS
jgi:adenylate cyclase